jgi:hypothetical protein
MMISMEDIQQPQGRVGFDSTMRIAVVYRELRQHELAGHMGFLYLRKSDEGWDVFYTADTGVW